MRKRGRALALAVTGIGLLVLVGAVAAGVWWALGLGVPPAALGGAAGAILVALALASVGLRRYGGRRVPLQVIETAGRHPLRPAVGRDWLNSLSPAEFQRVVGSLFEKEGYRVAPGPTEGPYRIDLVVSRHRRRGVVLCRLTPPGGVLERHVVRELYESMLYEEARQGFLITNGTFTLPATEWARNKSLELIDGAELASRLRQAQTQDVSS